MIPVVAGSSGREPAVYTRFKKIYFINSLNAGFLAGEPAKTVIHLLWLPCVYRYPYFAIVPPAGRWRELKVLAAAWGYAIVSSKRSSGNKVYGLLFVIIGI
jgi:hypothetical protein